MTFRPRRMDEGARRPIAVPKDPVGLRRIFDDLKVLLAGAVPPEHRLPTSG